MRWSDSHCHSTQGYSPQLRQELAQDGCALLLQGGIAPDEWSIQESLLDTGPPHIVPIFGIHPWTLATEDEAALELAWQKLEQRITSAQGVGEIGLDPLHAKTRDLQERQRKFFIRHLQLAAAHQKPCVFHIVRAYPEAIHLIAREYPEVRGLVHSFWAPAALAKPYLDAGLFLSLPPRIQKGDPHGILRYAPREQLVFESDSPQHFQDGSVSTPFLAKESQKHVAALWGEAWEVLAERQCRTLEALFYRP